jgi:hypothetical protein
MAGFVIPLILPLFACNAATLSISDISGAKGDIVTATLSINNAPNTARAFMLDVEYDVTCLSFQGFSSGTLVNGAYPLFTANNVEPGIVRLGGVASVSPGITKGSSGTVVALTFKVTGDKNSDLQISNLTDDMNKEGWSRQNGYFNINAGAENEGLSSVAAGNDGEDETLSSPSDDVGGEHEPPTTDPLSPILREKSESARELNFLMEKHLGKSKVDKDSSNTVINRLGNPEKQGEQQTDKRSIFHRSKSSPQNNNFASQSARKNTRDQLDTVSLSSRMSQLLNQQQQVETILWFQLICLIIQIIVLLLLFLLLINKFKSKKNP